MSQPAGLPLPATLARLPIRSIRTRRFVSKSMGFDG
jgi:hypothetical protein